MAYFCPKSYNTGEINLTIETHSIHHYTASWFTAHEQRVYNLYKWINSVLGLRVGNVVTKPIHWEEGFRMRIQKYGLSKTMQIYLQKMWR